MYDLPYNEYVQDDQVTCYKYCNSISFITTHKRFAIVKLHL